MKNSEKKQPWLVPGVPWKSESAFWQWVRGVLRKGWSKHPVKLEYIKQHRKQIKNPNPRGKKPEVWGMTCSICKKDHVQSEIEIDHVGDDGTFTCLEDSQDYIRHLFLVDFSSLREVCKPCHKIVSYSQRMGITFAEAQIDKKVIEICKNKTLALDYLASNGYSGASVSNEAKRRELVSKILREEITNGQD